MNTKVTSIFSQSRDAVGYLRRAGDSVRLAEAGWRPRYRRLSGLGATSLVRLRDAGGQHPRMTALLGASTAAVAAGTVYVVRHPGRPYADVLSDELPYRVSTLDDLRDDEESLELIQRELLAEWGAFGPQDMAEMQALVRNAGRLVYVIRFYEDGELGPPSGVLQTGLCDAGGDPAQLQLAYPSFDAISAEGSWQASASMRGDTAMLLQITAFGARSRGVGGRLRDTALYMLPPGVKYALTTTPVPAGVGIDSDPESNPAMKFHFRGGARPAGYARGFKQPAAERASGPPGRQANTDIVFMRYARLASGDWDGVKRPDLRLKHHALEIALPAGLFTIRRRLALGRTAAEQIAA